MYLARIIGAEQRDLLRGDIPLFTTRAESHVLFTSDGESLEDFFTESSLDLVRQRLQSLSPKDMDRQCWVVEAAMATLPINTEHVRGRIVEIKPTNQTVHKAELLAAARAIGDRLGTLAGRNASGVGWLGLNGFDRQTWSLLPTDIDLYSGSSGIALFLAYLGVMTGGAHYTELAQLALNAIRAQTTRPQRANPGAFSGLGSVLYLQTHISVLWHDQRLWHEAQALATSLPSMIAQDTALDFIGGAAGCILILLDLYSLYPDPATLDIACQCGDHLLATAQVMDQGKAWQTLPGQNL